VKIKCKRSLPRSPPGVEKTSMLGSRDPVASGVKCGPHGGKNDKMKSWTVSWLSLKTKAEPRLHRVRGISGGSPEKPLGSLVDPQSEDQRPEAATLDWWGTPV
jgi:hypothetical protein